MDRIYLLHGLMGTAKEHFRPQIEKWHQDYELVFLDLPGHGDNPEDAPEPFFQKSLDWVCERIKSLGPGHVVGLSLGASIAIHLTVKIPEYIKRVVLTGYTPAVPEDMNDLMNQQHHYFKQGCFIKYFCF